MKRSVGAVALRRADLPALMVMANCYAALRPDPALGLGRGGGSSIASVGSLARYALGDLPPVAA